MNLRSEFRDFLRLSQILDAGFGSGPYGPTPLEFADLYGIRCTESALYPPRTERNVIDADVTVIFGDIASRGSRLTIKLCEKHGKKWHHVQFPDGGPVNGYLELFLTLANPVILNVAGNRESKSPGIGDFVKSTLSAVIRRP